MIHQTNGDSITGIFKKTCEGWTPASLRGYIVMWKTVWKSVNVEILHWYNGYSTGIIIAKTKKSTKIGLISCEHLGPGS